MLDLHWHNYKYYPYEHELALREVEQLLQPNSVERTKTGLLVANQQSDRQAGRLVYFSSIVPKTADFPMATQQALLERVNGNGTRRQSTRYSAHGLHEYKGKFNPQIAKALLNIFGVQNDARVFDPFCGSGTSLVEAAHSGVRAVGIDINPLATFVANAKIASLGIDAYALEKAATDLLRRVKRSRRKALGSGARIDYLKQWFQENVLLDIERLRSYALSSESGTANILLTIASNLLREYSLQDPGDLRIRRRKDPLPKVPFLDAFESSVGEFVSKLSASQSVLGLLDPRCEALKMDGRYSNHHLTRIAENGFDFALTSPPYATALPYIDTQRLSLVWLDLLTPQDVHRVGAELIGSREIRGVSKADLLDKLKRNDANLPTAQSRFCMRLQNAIGEKDGFRRKAVPILLYRYFEDMARSFSQTHRLMKPGAKFALIVGTNHTTLGGERFDIDTPSHLINIATSLGWRHFETVGLQTYKRYGLHAKNASMNEALIVFSA